MKHDIERHEGDEVICRCGERFKSAEDHLFHFRIEDVRAQLPPRARG